MDSTDSNVPAPVLGKAGSPFDTIRRVDEYGREYWSARALQPVLGYDQWRRFADAIDQAKAVIAAEHGGASADSQIAATGKITRNARGQRRTIPDFHLSRYAAYLTAMRGDGRKPEIRGALIYFAVRTRQAELNDLFTDDINRTALARAREMVDYQTFRGMMAGNAPDYEPSSKHATIFFAVMQNKLYQHVTGMTANQIRGARELETWPGRPEGKPEPSERAACRNVAKNYLTAVELSKLNRIVAILCLTAEEIAEDGLSLSLAQWEQIVDTELALRTRRLTAAA